MMQSGERDLREPAARSMPWWAWGLIAFGVVGLLSCVSCFGLLMNSPDTYIYAGNEVPEKYLRTVRKMGLLNADEKPIWFYSDGLLGVGESFYYVSDRQVVIYREDTSPPEIIVDFTRIANAELYRDTSFITDSSITLTFDDGQIVAFPVSSEKDRDRKFFEAILTRAPQATHRELP